MTLSALPLPKPARRFAAASLPMLAAGLLLSGCVSKPKSEVVVSVKDQKMGIYDQGKLKKQFVISTSKFGVGDQPNSYRTPLGKHEVIAKIGHGLPTGAVLKSRHWNGEVLKPNAPGRDPIVSRILWLRGLEKDNRNAMRRYIYIHGTTEESRLGTPASYGCIRMGMKDVVEAFNEVGIGAKVVITKDHLPKGAPAPKEPGPDAEPAKTEAQAGEKAAAPESPASTAPAA
ncbi:MAG TPA: L,D-transpeptidase family protein, partial [Prosthecobacter sp.]|nr:L,D-transpeptidase family protein [Prosthecobacter sp.]